LSDLISTDAPFDAAQLERLDALLDTLLPASEDGRMPSAAETGFNDYLRTQGAAAIPMLRTMLQALDADFANANLPQRCAQVEAWSQANPELFAGVLTHVYDCYYQHDRVRAALGMVQGAVFPQGNEVTPGDLSLLDPVIANSSRHQYRRL